LRRVGAWPAPWKVLGLEPVSEQERAWPAPEEVLGISLEKGLGARPEVIKRGSVGLVFISYSIHT
jgi:hypothetical protein